MVTPTPPSSGPTWCKPCGATTAFATTVLVTFDYGSLVALELLRRQLDQRDAVGGGTGLITAVFMINGGLFADAHSHPWQGTPLLRTPIGRVGVRQWERSPRSSRRPCFAP